MIRVATYNILHGSLKGLEGIASTLAAIDADLIGLQEVDQGVTRSGAVDQAAILGGKLGYHHAFAAACPWGEGLYGLALLSRFPILRHQGARLPSGLADGTEPRIVLEAEIELPPGRLGEAGGVHFAVTHLGLDPTERLLQGRFLTARLGGRPRTLLCGDLNEGRTEAAFGHLIGALDDCIAEAGSAPLRSYPADSPTIGIDHVLRSRDLPRASRAWAISSARASDHLPVVVDLG